MSAQPINILALDIDGTLAVADHQILPRTRQALFELHEDGVEIVIATGRRFRTTSWVMENLGFDVHAICNGASYLEASSLANRSASLLVSKFGARLTQEEIDGQLRG